MAAPASLPKSGFPPSGLAGADGGFVHDAIPARTIGLKDLRDSLRKGWADVMTKSRHVVFLAGLRIRVNFGVQRVRFRGNCFSSLRFFGVV